MKIKITIIMIIIIIIINNCGQRPLQPWLPERSLQARSYPLRVQLFWSEGYASFHSILIFIQNYSVSCAGSRLNCLKPLFYL